MGRHRALSAERSRSLQTAIYQINPRFTERSQRLNFGSPSGTTGYHAVAELGWTPTLPASPARLGLWRNTGDFEDLCRDSSGLPLSLSGASAAEHDHATGGYLMAEQRVGRAPRCRRDG